MKAENILLILTIAGVFSGVALGVALHLFNSDKERPLTPREVNYLRFPGEIFLRMLKMLILPLIASSLINALSSLDSGTAGKMGLVATAYYMTTTFLAICTGIALVLLIQPGHGNGAGGADHKQSECGDPIPTDTLMDLLRNMFPDNLVRATFYGDSTCVKYITYNESLPTPIDAIRYKNLDNMTQAMYYENPMLQSTSGMNILGIVVFSLVFGGVINRLGDDGRPLANFFLSLEKVIMMMVTLVIWLSPIGIMFLIAGEVVNMSDFGEEIKNIGLYMLTVITGLLVHAIITLPLLLLILGRRNPFPYVYGMLQAIITAFGTASSSATMPVTLECLEKNNGINPKVSRFVIPLGATINMDGTALYEAVAAIYIAQATGVNLNFGQVLLVSITATLASIGAAGIPQAGLVTLIMVLLAVGLDPRYTERQNSRDRIRTAVNVHGDSLGAAVIQTLCKNQLHLDIEESPSVINETDEDTVTRTNTLQLASIEDDAEEAKAVSNHGYESNVPPSYRDVLEEKM